MNPITFLPFTIIAVYLAIIIGVFILIYNWVNKFISLKQEQNEILRDIARKLENK
jgi:hypothetical protein